MTSNVFNDCKCILLTLFLSIIVSQQLLRSNQSLFFGLSSLDPLSVPSLMVDKGTNSAVEYKVSSTDTITDKVIAGYEVTRFGVPMVGQYVNAGTDRKVTISPAVPGAQYRITAWALGDGRRSAIPAKYPTTEASGCDILTRTFTPELSVYSSDY